MASRNSRANWLAWCVVVQLILPVAYAHILAQAKTGTIAGRIVGMDGMPAVGIRVAVATADKNGGVTANLLVGMTVTDENGRYQINNVLPGRYGVIAGALQSPTYYPGTTVRDAAKTITIEAGITVDGMDFKLAASPVPPQGPQGDAQILAQLRGGTLVRPRPPQITGRILVEGSSVTPEFVRAHPLQFTDGRFTVTGSGASNTMIIQPLLQAITVEPDGTFHIPIVPDLEYRIQAARSPFVKPADDYTIKAMSFGTLDMLRNPLIAASSMSQEIQITFGIGSQIRGNVKAENGSAAANVQVYLLPISTRIGSTAVGSAITDAQGNFTIRAVGRGEYGLQSDNVGQQGGAPRVEVTGGPAAPVNLILLAGPPSRRFVLAP